MPRAKKDSKTALSLKHYSPMKEENVQDLALKLLAHVLQPNSGDDQVRIRSDEPAKKKKAASEYNEFVGSFIKGHPGATMKDAAAAWRKYLASKAAPISAADEANSEVEKVDSTVEA